MKTRYVVLAIAAGLLFGVLLLWFGMAPKSAARSDAEMAALQRPLVASMGRPDARVHIVEFLDPACETCADFYPRVKKMLADNPDRIRLSVRLLAFHKGVDVAVKALEASKAQGKFWMVLDRLLASQPRWVVQHNVNADAVWEQLRSLDLDVDRLKADMESPEVKRNMALDAQDAKTLKVTQTPEYFVNGRGLPEFGFAQLQRLVADETASAYR